MRRRGGSGHSGLGHSNNGDQVKDEDEAADGGGEGPVDPLRPPLSHLLLRYGGVP